MKKGRKHRETDLAKFWDGRDENNLAEFPLALLTDSVPKGQKTIEFVDTLKDWSTGKEIVRRVCITGSDKFGLPTAKDEDVLLALLQLTKLFNNFKSPEVWFNKHQVIEILGWKNRGWAYGRVEESLHRWKGVSIHYWNAWRDKARDAWCDSAAIGVIEYFVLGDGRGRKSSHGEGAGRSRFVWSKMFFESFQAGYLKKLDFGIYRQLRRPAARRAFRFLGKRFWHERRWEFELRQFACEKLGFSRSYTTGQLKERLYPALSELARIGFIEPVSYRKEKPKLWKVAIVKKKVESATRKVDGAEPHGLLAELTRRGVAAKAAHELVEKYSLERVTEKMEFHDWLLQMKDKRINGNPAGFLVAAIRDGYPLPKGFRTKAMREVEAKEEQEHKKKAEEAMRRQQEKENGENEGRLCRMKDYVASLGKVERQRFIAAAIDADKGILRMRYQRNAQDGELQGVYLDLMLRNYFEKTVESAASVLKAEVKA